MLGMIRDYGHQTREHLLDGQMDLEALLWGSGSMGQHPTKEVSPFEGSSRGFASSSFTVLELDPEGEMGIWLGDLAHCS
jgi:hypothetical protein